MAILSEEHVGYEGRKPPLLRESMIIQYLPLVRYVARKLVRKLPRGMDFEDLVGYGMVGLIDAVDRFDLTRGIKFESYAVLRIRGEIVDQLRKLDWIPRSLRARARAIDKAYFSLWGDNSRPPTDEEIAESLCTSVDNTRKAKFAVSVVVQSLNQPLDLGEQSLTIADTLEDPNWQSQETQTEKRELLSRLIEATARLGPRQQRLITFRYRDELTMQAISKFMGISESRVSQLHRSAIARLKDHLNEFQN